jgi:hypothetical protein
MVKDYPDAASAIDGQFYDGQAAAIGGLGPCAIPEVLNDAHHDFRRAGFHPDLQQCGDRRRRSPAPSEARRIRVHAMTAAAVDCSFVLTGQPILEPSSEGGTACLKPSSGH